MKKYKIPSITKIKLNDNLITSSDIAHINNKLFIVTGSSNGSINIYNNFKEVNNSYWITKSSNHEIYSPQTKPFDDLIYSIKINKTTKKILSTTNKGVVKIWDINRGTLENIYQDISKKKHIKIYDCCFNIVNPKVIAYCSSLNNLNVVDMSIKKYLYIKRNNFSSFNVSFSPLYKDILFQGLLGRIEFINLATKSIKTNFFIKNISTFDFITSFTFENNNLFFSSNKKIFKYDFKNNKIINIHNIVSTPIYSIIKYKDYILFTTLNQIRIFNCIDFRCIHNFDIKNHIVLLKNIKDNIYLLIKK